uniref:Uncharacterized protein n=1 Tax=Plectus sambesii TaxID=2011161 RepID=A0A914X923_9BILA
MQFLAAMKVVHRDIALRNVLLKLDFTVKVADFGLARKLKKNNDAYHILKNETALPIRYIAPESLKSHRFAITSELWSFGVVIWELFTFAEEQPYSVEFENHKSNLQFFDFLIEHLSSGQRLSIPNICPQQIKNLLTRLWDLDPEKRPSFQECEKVIEEGLMQSCPNMHEKLKNALERSLHDICQDLDAEDVLPYLRSKGIVTDRQTQEIMKSTRKFTQNMQLIDYIKGAGPSAFHEFINSLQACNKEHIAEKILAHLPSSSAQQLTLLELNTVQAPCSSSSSSTQSNTKNWEKALE